MGWDRPCEAAAAYARGGYALSRGVDALDFFATRSRVPRVTAVSRPDGTPVPHPLDFLAVTRHDVTDLEEDRWVAEVAGEVD